MKSFRFVILGAGPSGLGFAHALLDSGEESFLLLEKEEVAGGLCRSVQVDGAPLDIGGGHFLDPGREEVLRLLFRFLPKPEWNVFRRISTIRLRGKEIDYPLEANLWQLPVGAQLEFLDSIARAGCVRGEPMPESFEKWITWKLGERIAAEYMLPYNRKIWSCDLDRLGTYWLHKLPHVSFRDTLRCCLERRPYGSLPAHGTFLYPKESGYGEVWRRMGEELGDRLLPATPVRSLDVRNRVVNGRYRAEKIITTIPWTLWPGFARLPARIVREISRLDYASIDVDYLSGRSGTSAHWVYDPDEKLPHHRILCRGNFLPGAKGYWTEANAKRSGESPRWRNRNEFAYPLNTRRKPKAVAEILRWSERNSIVGIGRWGMWEHMNSDVAVLQGIRTAEKLTGGKPQK